MEKRDGKLLPCNLFLTEQENETQEDAEDKKRPKR